MKILIKVTKEVLRRSARCEQRKLGTNCAIALAVRDIFPDAFVGVRNTQRYNRIAIHPALKIFDWIELPNEAHGFINTFDALKTHERIKMEPLSFEVDVPDSIVEEIGISQVEEILSKSETLEKV